MSKIQNGARLFLAGVISVTAIACGPSSAGGPPSPNIPGEPSTELPKPISGATTWKLQPSSADHLYFTVSDTRLKLTDSSTVADELIISRVEFKISSSIDTRGPMLSATVNTFSIESGSRTGPSTSSAPVPFSVTGHLQNSKLLFTFSGTSTELNCTNPVHTTLSAIQRAFITPPSDLHTGMTWSDSLSSQICSGGFPVVAEINRNYRVLGERILGAIPVILLERHDRTTLAGEGSSGQHRVALQAETIGSGQVAIDRATGFLVDDMSTYTTSITIRSSGRNQKFTQVVREHIALK